MDSTSPKKETDELIASELYRAYILSGRKRRSLLKKENYALSFSNIEKKAEEDEDMKEAYSSSGVVHDTVVTNITKNKSSKI